MTENILKVEDLHIGDRVLFSNAPCKVIGISKNGVTLDLSNFDDAKEEQCCADLCDISPIPLTEELLERNGYSFTFDDGILRQYEDDCFRIKETNDGRFLIYLKVSNDDEEVDVLVTIAINVHELQHTFWVLSGDDNFDI